MKNVVRIGKISSVNEERMRARVVFEDKDSTAGQMVSAELPILTIGAGTNKVYFNYRVGESVLCLFCENAEDGTGYIVGSFNSDESELRANNLHVTRFDFGDKFTIEYEEESGDVNIKIRGNLTVEAEKEMILKGKNIRLN